jgi:hypothetical protein
MEAAMIETVVQVVVDHWDFYCRSLSHHWRNMTPTTYFSLLAGTAALGWLMIRNQDRR